VRPGNTRLFNITLPAAVGVVANDPIEQRGKTEGKAYQKNSRRLKMNTDQNKANRKWTGWALAGILVLAGLGFTVRAVDTGRLAFAAAAPQMTFQSPAEAATALAQAAKDTDEKALTKVLGGESKALITSGDSESDKAAMQQFFSKYQQMNRWVDMSDGSRVLYIGADNFAFPVPLAKNVSGSWYFDAVAGAQEIRARQIGKNELLTIDAVAALADAEQSYSANSDSGEYAQRIVSTPGKQDGLYWATSDSLGASPLARLQEFPKSSLTSLSPNQPFVIDGYTLRILSSQGDDAPGGAQNYIVNGKMTEGFAILATPAKYGETGIMSFMIGREGFVYERDLGPDTVKNAAPIQEYNPDNNWSPID
jgi:hypothetical protein